MSDNETLAAGNGTSLADGDLLPHGERVARVMHEEFLATALVLLVFRVLHVALHRDGRRVFHRRLDDDAIEEFTLPTGPLRRSVSEASRQAGKSIAELEKEYGGKNYSVFKNDLAEIIIKSLSPIQKKYKELSANPDYLKKVLRDGAEKAKTIASQTMREVRSKIGFLEI